MSPAQAFLLVTGIVALTIIIPVVAYRMLRRAERPIAEHSDSYWSTRR